MDKKKMILPAAALAGLGMLGWAHFVEPERLVVTRLALGEKTAGREVRVAFFTDTHFGKDNAVDNMVRIAGRINSERPDMVIFGGDLMDQYCRDKPDLEQLSAGLAAVIAPLGKYAVWGNHDYSGYAESVYPKVMERGGFTLLRNRSKVLERQGLAVTGVDDWMAGEPLREAAERAPDSAFQLLVSHEPDLMDNMDTRRVGLALAGHTHGGQVRLPLLKFAPVLPKGGKSHVKGLGLLKNGRTPVFVSSGIGTAHLRLRMWNPPEIAILDIRY